MRKITISLLCVFAMVSCQKSLETAVSASQDEAIASFSVAMNPSTKATIDFDGAGASINRCVLEVYSNNKLYRHIEAEVDSETLTASFQVPLVISQTYDFLFWADAATLDSFTRKFTDLYYNTTSLKAVTIIDETSGNIDAKDAFFANLLNHQFTGAESQDITLTRPLAQVNIVTNDLLEVAKTADSSLSSELWPAKISVDYETQMPTVFNAYNGEVSETKTIARKAEAVYGCVTAAAYNTLGMDYFFVAASTDPDDPEEHAVFKITKSDITLSNNSVITILEAKDNIPIKRNFRTNIIGSFLTDPMDLAVTIDPLWKQPDYEPLPTPSKDDEPQGCVLQDPDPDTGDIVAAADKGATVVVVPAGATKIDLNPGHQAGVYNMDIQSLTAPSSVELWDQSITTFCKNLGSITWKCDGDHDLKIDQTCMYGCGENLTEMTLNVTGIPKSLKKYNTYNDTIVDMPETFNFNLGEGARVLTINLPAGWKNAGLTYKFGANDSNSCVVYEDGLKIWPEN